MSDELMEMELCRDTVLSTVKDDISDELLQEVREWRFLFEQLSATQNAVSQMLRKCQNELESILREKS